MDDAITAVEEAFRQLALGDAVLPQRVGIGLAKYGGGGAAMPAYVGGNVDGLGLKVVTLFPGNPGERDLPAVMATMILLNPRSGALLAVVEAGLLTAMRTGAVSGVATRYLARPDAATVTVFGAGAQARTQLSAICAVRPIKRAFVVDPVSEAAQRYASEMTEQLNIPVEPAGDARAAVEMAGVVITAITAHEPLFDGNWLCPGVHINGIGSHSPGARELDTTVIQRAKVVTDQTAACLAEAGDLIVPIQEGTITEAHIHAQLGEIVAGLKPGRKADDEITLFKSVGLAIQDVAVAVQVFKKAQAAGIGQVLEA
jgi:ornithine cyclodeaminase/alanine dehydrogenase